MQLFVRLRRRIKNPVPVDELIPCPFLNATIVIFFLVTIFPTMTALINIATIRVITKITTARSFLGLLVNIRYDFASLLTCFFRFTSL